MASRRQRDQTWLKTYWQDGKKAENPKEKGRKEF
jgi:hypothetical protein